MIFLAIQIIFLPILPMKFVFLGIEVSSNKIFFLCSLIFASIMDSSFNRVYHDFQARVLSFEFHSEINIRRSTFPDAEIPGFS